MEVDLILDPKIHDEQIQDGVWTVAIGQILHVAHGVVWVGVLFNLKTYARIMWLVWPRGMLLMSPWEWNSLQYSSLQLVKDT